MKLCHLLISLCLFQVSCDRDEVATLHHKAEDPVRDPMAWNWADISKQDIRDIMGFKTDGVSVAPAERAIQHWMDRLDHILRLRYPDVMVSIPKPQALVVMNHTANAYVQTVPVCYDAQFVFGAGEREFTQIYHDRQSGFEPAQTPCVNGGRESLQAVLSGLQHAHPECSILQKGHRYELNGCPAFDGVNAASKQLVMSQTSNVVTFYSGLFALMEKEEEFVAVVYHELAHYYRSHGLADAQSYRFLYRSVDYDREQYPHALVGYDFEKYHKAHLVVRDYMPVTDHAQLAASAFLLAGEIASRTCEDGCVPVCHHIADWYDDPVRSKAFGWYPFDANGVGDKGLYSDFESFAQLCLEDVAYKKFDVTQELRWGFYKRLDRRQSIQVLSFLEKSQEGFHAFEFENSWEYLLELTQRERAGYRNALGTLQEAVNENLGWYTEEQEADEISLEWLATAGLSPKHGVHAYVKLADMNDPLKTCEKLYQDDWKENDHPASLDMGGFLDPHHDSCYRAWNADQELQSHRYPVRKHVRRGLSWDLVKESVLHPTQRLMGDDNEVARTEGIEDGFSVKLCHL